MSFTKDRGRRMVPGVLVVMLVAVSARAEPCRPVPDPDRPQAVFGYGSLISDARRARIVPDAGPAVPATVAGWRRAWSVHAGLGFVGVTLLGVRPAAGAVTNGMLFAVDDLTALDAAERNYCRRRLDPTAVRVLVDAPAPAGTIWIYVGRGEDQPPGPRFPIPRSYAELFLAGCRDQAIRWDLPGFARRCVTGTRGWQGPWLGDVAEPDPAFDRLLEGLGPTTMDP